MGEDSFSWLTSHCAQAPGLRDGMISVVSFGNEGMGRQGLTNWILQTMELSQLDWISKGLEDCRRVAWRDRAEEVHSGYVSYKVIMRIDEKRSGLIRYALRYTLSKSRQS